VVLAATSEAVCEAIQALFKEFRLLVEIQSKPLLCSHTGWTAVGRKWTAVGKKPTNGLAWGISYGLYASTCLG